VIIGGKKLNENNKYKKYVELARRIRANALREVCYGKSGHIGSALSMAEMLAYLYESVLKYKSDNPKWENRDIFILSKGHAASGLYAVLAEKGFFPREWMKKYYQDGGMLSGHVSHYVPGIEVSTGSLGHGLPIGIGYAIHFRKNNRKNRVFVLLSDGETNEGSNWEAFLFAPHHNLDNLTIIIDYNKIQALGRCENVLTIEPLAQKLRDFHWEVKEVNGHNFKDIERALSKIPIKKGKPSCIISNTVKGKGVSFLENTVSSHYYHVTEELLKKAYEELGVEDENSF
jgi:transketolase